MKLILLLLFPMFPSLAFSHAAHVHGEAQLSAAIESNKARFEMEAPKEVFYGFEYAAKSKKEKSTVETVNADLQTKWSVWVDLGQVCKWEKAKLKSEDEEDGHANLVITVDVECPKPISKKISLQLSLPKLNKLKFSIIGENMQKAATFVSGKGSIDL